MDRIPDGKLKDNLGYGVNINKPTDHTAIIIILPSIARQGVGSCLVAYVVARFQRERQGEVTPGVGCV
jgi:hypothetical protein